MFPAAMDTDASDLLPVSHLDLLAREGFYGIAGPVDAGGSNLDPTTTTTVVEALASGCLTTAFVWLQHRNPVRAVAASETPGLRDAWLEPLCRGERRAGIALAGNRPGPPILRASNTAHGDVVLDGEAPWVSGWGRIDVILVTARDGDRVVSVLVDANESPTLHAEHLRLVGANASGTVTLRFHDHVVPAERVVGAEPHADVLARDATGLRLNGSLALGVVDRCCRLMGPSAFDEQLGADPRVRSRTRRPRTSRRLGRRPRSSPCAPTAALTVAHGSRSILTDQHPQRLAREAQFLLVFGSRPLIKAELSRRLADHVGPARAGTLRLDAHRRQLRTAPDPSPAAAPIAGRTTPTRSRRTAAIPPFTAIRDGSGRIRTGSVREIEEMARRDPGAPGGWMQLSVEDRETGELVGDVGLSPADDEPGVIKIGYTMSPAFQGRGYATEAVAALIAYAFDTLGADVVRAYASAENLAVDPRRREGRDAARRNGSSAGPATGSDTSCSTSSVAPETARVTG